MPTFLSSHSRREPFSWSISTREGMVFILSKSVIFRETEVLMAKNQDEQILCIRKGKH